ncbi:hypothetical protein B0H11DRAFT_2277624 [Mycena galericulata]|nr:hypothetical protein B0H11DRAFT_2277624 [Mycena galericulata]
MSLSLISVNLLSFTIGTLLYGMYAVLFIISMYLLLLRRHATTQGPNEIHKKMVFKSMVFLSAILLFLVVTVHWVTTVYRAFIGFGSIQDRAEAEIFLSDLAQPTAVVQDTFIALSFVVGDSLIIYRLSVVWSHNARVLVFPILSLTTFAVAGFISTSFTARNNDVFANPWLTTTAFLTLATNLYCTAFMSWKIWITTRLSSASGGPNLRHFLVIVVESAAFYALWAVLFVVAFEAKSNLQATVIQTGPEVIGVVNALIMTRVGLGWTSEQIGSVPHPPSSLVFAASEGSQ